METIPCIVCGDASPRSRFTKNSGSGEPFRLVRCRRCGLEFLSPRPAPAEIGVYYSAGYFEKRTDRGYDDYFSPALEREVTRVLAMNLRDLGFFEYEASLPGPKLCLDIGCAAGYSVGFMQGRGWESSGIDIAGDCIDFGLSRGLNVRKGDYMETEYGKMFHLITMWATIEHLHRPDKILKKACADLHDGGLLYISTCRTGGINFKVFRGAGWRYYNFPEHLYFFSRSTMGRLLGENGFRITMYSTYGSGFGRPGSAPRRTADRLAKRFGWGDMMILAAVKG